MNVIVYKNQSYLRFTKNNFMPKSIIQGGEGERRLLDELEKDAVCHQFYSTCMANTFWSGDFKHEDK